MSLEYCGVLVGAANWRCFRVWVTKTEINTASVFRVFDLLYIHIKPYESELSTALSECKAVARCATRKTDTAINRIKTVGACKTGNTTRKTNIATNRIWTFDGSYIELRLWKVDAVMLDVRRLPIMEKEEWWCLTNGGRSDCFHMIKHSQWERML